MSACWRGSRLLLAPERSLDVVRTLLGGAAHFLGGLLHSVSDVPPRFLYLLFRLARGRPYGTAGRARVVFDAVRESGVRRREKKGRGNVLPHLHLTTESSEKRRRAAKADFARSSPILTRAG